MVCGSCNSGWLSALEGAAKPVLQPLILGEARRLPDDDQALIAAWTCKTALVSLLQHSQGDRRDGYQRITDALGTQDDDQDPGDEGDADSEPTA